MNAYIVAFMRECMDLGSHMELRFWLHETEHSLFFMMSEERQRGNKLLPGVA